MFIEDRYEVEVDDSISLFEFGDKDEETGMINDKVITDNGDSEKVLATVAATIYAFTAENPKIYVYITGSNEARTRLYRMGISKYFEEINEDFEVRGLQNNAWKPFKPDGNYKAFLVNRKI